jgi:hypothetical protein
MMQLRSRLYQSLLDNRSRPGTRPDGLLTADQADRRSGTSTLPGDFVVDFDTLNSKLEVDPNPRLQWSYISIGAFTPRPSSAFCRTMRAASTISRRASRRAGGAAVRTGQSR